MLSNYGQLGTAWHWKEPTGPGRKFLPVLRTRRGKTRARHAAVLEAEIAGAGFRSRQKKAAPQGGPPVQREQ